MTVDLFHAAAVRLEPEAALRLRAMHGEVEARRAPTGRGASSSAMAAERRGVHQRHGARPVRQQQRRERHVQAPGRDSRASTVAGRSRAQDLPQAPQRARRKTCPCARACAAARRGAGRTRWCRPIEAGQRHVHALFLEPVGQAHDLALRAADAEVVEHEQHVGARRGRRSCGCGLRRASGSRGEHPHRRGYVMERFLRRPRRCARAPVWFPVVRGSGQRRALVNSRDAKSRARRPMFSR